MTRSLYDAVSAVVSAAWRDGHTDFKGNLESYRQELVGLLQGVPHEAGGDVGASIDEDAPAAKGES